MSESITIFPLIAVIALGVIAAIVTGLVLINKKKRTSSQNAQYTPAKSEVTRPSFCRECGTKIVDGDTFCPECGAAIK